ncbi:MAG: hypothetical protein JRJ51_08280 [Deltaproteobacteria bacterium]|nr:hypothetical protein [Deltaproteobacteria bacterium]
MSNPKAKVLALDKVDVDRIYEEQLDHHFGINKFTCGSESLSMSFPLEFRIGAVHHQGQGKVPLLPGR